MKFIDLFCGIGGFRSVLEKFEHECIFSCDIDKFARKTYKENYGDEPAGDITKIKEQDIPTHDLLCAGFPCPAFSLAGKKKGFDDPRGKLFFEIIRIAKFHNPSILFLENVKNLVSHDKGKTFEIIKNELVQIGYNVNFKVLNAKNFGLPQNRARVFLICLKNGGTYNFPNDLNIETKLSDILEKNIEDKYTLSNNLWGSLQRIKEKHLAKGNGFGYCLFDEDAKYVSTISARYYKDGAEILVKQNNKNPRRLTPREALNLQGYPDNFKIVCSDAQTYRQVGNSLSLNVIREIVKELEIQNILIN